MKMKKKTKNETIVFEKIVFINSLNKVVLKTIVFIKFVVSLTIVNNKIR